MRIRSLSGAAIYQYIIIILLIALASLPVFMSLGNTLVGIFSNFTNAQSDNNKQVIINSMIPSISNGTVEAGQLGGSSQAPVSGCSGNNCAVDFGTIILNNVPSNFSDIVETTGSAGGTEVVLGLIEQVAQQLETGNSNLTPDQLAKVKALVAQGKDIMTVEKHFENIIKPYEQDLKNYVEEGKALKALYDSGQISQAKFESDSKALANKYSALSTAFSNQPDIVLDNGVKISSDPIWMIYLLNPNASMSYNNTTQKISSAGTGFNIGESLDAFLAKDYSNYLSSTTSQGYTTTLSPVGGYVKELQSIVNDDTYDPTLKQLTKVLSEQVFNLSQEVYDLVMANQNIQFGGSWYSNYVFDADNVIDNPASVQTNLDMAIVCAASGGTYDSDAKTCNNP